MPGKEIKIHLGTGQRIRKIGVFNFAKLYESLKEWIQIHHYDFNEKEYTLKETDKGKEIIISWEAEREVTDYIKYFFKVDFLLENVFIVEKDLFKGKILITFTAKLQLDYREKWKHNKISEFFFKLYNEYLVKKEIEHHQIKLYNEMMDLHKTAKDILEFYK
jgi:hypothetical protein